MISPAIMEIVQRVTKRIFWYLPLVPTFSINWKNISWFYFYIFNVRSNIYQEYVTTKKIISTLKAVIIMILINRSFMLVGRVRRLNI